MDPQATWYAIVELLTQRAYSADDALELAAHLRALAHWLDRGGFRPVVTT